MVAVLNVKKGMMTITVVGKGGRISKGESKSVVVTYEGVKGIACRARFRQLPALLV